MGMPLHDGLISKWSHFWNISSFLERFFFTEALKMICRMDFDMSFGILIVDP